MCSGQDFSTLALLMFRAGQFFVVVVDCPMHRRLYNSIPGPYVLDAMASSPQWWQSSVFNIAKCQQGLGYKNHPSENQCFNALGGLDEAQISKEIVFLGLYCFHLLYYIFKCWRNQFTEHMILSS